MKAIRREEKRNNNRKMVVSGRGLFNLLRLKHKRHATKS